MYGRPQFRGLGLAKLMLNHLAEYAREQGAGLLRLETGIYQSEAIGLYDRMGFYRIPPFGIYRPGPLSVFFEKKIRWRYLRCGLSNIWIVHSFIGFFHPVCLKSHV